MLPILKPRNRSTWSARVARAQQLAESSSSAGEVLSFYAGILEFQQGIYAEYHKEAIIPAGGTLRDCIDVEQAAKVLPELIALVRKRGPLRLAERAAELSHEDARSKRIEKEHARLDRVIKGVCRGC